MDGSLGICDRTRCALARWFPVPCGHHPDHGGVPQQGTMAVCPAGCAPGDVADAERTVSGPGQHPVGESSSLPDWLQPIFSATRGAGVCPRRAAGRRRPGSAGKGIRGTTVPAGGSSLNGMGLDLSPGHSLLRVARDPCLGPLARAHASQRICDPCALGAECDRSVCDQGQAR